MCGIAGFWQREQTEDRDSLTQRALTMVRTIAHRGPDFQSGWADEAAGVGFGHARLAILDLSSSANQPLHSPDGRYTIVFNGEIYNFRELSSELRSAGYTFRTTGDTEIIPAAVDAWGIKNAVRRLNGIFAFAIWDSRMRVLHLARDPIGVKPLYYQLNNGALTFASTPKALFPHPDFDGAIDPGSLALFLRYSYVPEPRSIFAGVSKLSPGTILTIDGSFRTSITRYWDVGDEALAARRDPFRGTEGEASRAFDALASGVVRQQLVSDVPLGAFLSGGIDSSLVTALMQTAASGRVKTFTIGFDDSRFDESGYAREVARHLGTEHTEVICTTREARDVIPELPTYYDEPFADSSQIPTLLLSRITRGHVTVALSGDGGDELFAGYDRYYWMYRLRALRRSMPAPASRWLLAASRRMPRERTFPWLQRIFRSPSRWIERADRLYHLARMLERFDDYGYLYRTTPMSVATLRDVSILRNEGEPVGVFDDAALREQFPDVVDWMQIVDQKTYLVEDILHKVDRASMAYGLEARVPLLDPRLVQFSWRLPGSMKLDGKRGKRLMRLVLSRYLPQRLIERPKRGFSVPLGDWLAGDLRAWASALLGKNLIERDDLLDANGVHRCWSNFLTGHANHTQSTVWALLMFLAWRERYGF